MSEITEKTKKFGFPCLTRKNHYLHTKKKGIGIVRPDYMFALGSFALSLFALVIRSPWVRSPYFHL